MSDSINFIFCFYWVRKFIISNFNVIVSYMNKFLVINNFWIICIIYISEFKIVYIESFEIDVFYLFYLILSIFYWWKFLRSVVFIIDVFVFWFFFIMFKYSWKIFYFMGMFFFIFINIMFNNVIFDCFNRDIKFFYRYFLVYSLSY